MTPDESYQARQLADDLVARAAIAREHMAMVGDMPASAEATAAVLRSLAGALDTARQRVKNLLGEQAAGIAFMRERDEARSELAAYLDGTFYARQNERIEALRAEREQADAEAAARALADGGIVWYEAVVWAGGEPELRAAQDRLGLGAP